MKRIINASFDSLSVLNESRFYGGVTIKESEIARRVSIGSQSIVRFSKLDEYVEIGRRNTIDHSSIQVSTYTGEFTLIKYAQIGKYTAISWNNSIGGANHDIMNLSMLPRFRIFREVDNDFFYDSWLQKCSVGNDVWIGSGCHVLRGVEIPDGCVVGANSVVCKTPPPYSVIAGVPAKVIKFRFPQEMIELLMQIEWWNFPHDILINHCHECFNHHLTISDLEYLLDVKKNIVTKGKVQ